MEDYSATIRAMKLGIEASDTMCKQRSKSLVEVYSDASLVFNMNKDWLTRIGNDRPPTDHQPH